ncbi:toxin-antitoxin system, toxin component, MazF family protein [Pediococcus ethanolidurans]|nr:toxin-antitoxin system, toxin component, MazF family protein [Pediococcus ethanolidurans]MCV3323701.1 toxin-antitoxin system, toxin component, MazF family protein [Pediococcus ethanolidurans]MCV3555243.1 toxin-antitoxin system, toxin component, MazF family protein [Pediococcus ethanolidurans]
MWDLLEEQEIKGRPVIILENKDGILHFFNSISKFNSKSDRIKAQYFEIRDWNSLGLKGLLYIDIGTIFSIKLNTIDHAVKLGKLSLTDVKELTVFIRKYRKKLGNKVGKKLTALLGS